MLNSLTSIPPMRPAVTARRLTFSGSVYFFSSDMAYDVTECENTRKRYALAVPMFLTAITGVIN